MNYRNLFCYLLISGNLFSSAVSVYNAETVARNFLNIKHSSSPHNELIITSVEVLKDNMIALIYLFYLSPDGFIMISADDRSTPILAYSFENSFKLNRMSQNVSWIIDQYKNNIHNVIISDAPVNNSIANKWNKYLNENTLERQQGNAVYPLITAKFDQGGNWNNKCPPGCNDQEALVGCVAVSMSQIMHYWKYPMQGT